MTIQINDKCYPVESREVALLFANDAEAQTLINQLQEMLYVKKAQVYDKALHKIKVVNMQSLIGTVQAVSYEKPAKINKVKDEDEEFYNSDENPFL